MSKRGIHANENCGINFAADVGFTGLRLCRKLGQIVDDEDSCEIMRIVKSLKPGFPTSSDGGVSSSFELREIYTPFMDDYVYSLAFPVCARGKIAIRGPCICTEWSV